MPCYDNLEIADRIAQELARHAGTVIASYARVYEGQPELAILKALGHFNRPAEPDSLKLLLPEVDEPSYLAALKRLHDAGLISTGDPAQPLDCDPVVREYFAAQATRRGHAILYLHYKKKEPRRPDTLEQMTPLIHAAFHGCRAGLHNSVLVQIYCDRILRHGEFYLTKKLGAFETDLGLLANFFAIPWTLPVATLKTADRIWVIAQAGFTLRALGRLAEALAPMKEVTEADARKGRWKSAAASHGNLSQLHLLLGNVAEAVAVARQAVDFAERTGDPTLRIPKISLLADALHQSGDIDEALRLFAEAERLQAEACPEFAILYSLRGYQYCDLLLGQGRTEEVRRRASQTLQWAVGRLLDTGLDHLSLGRAHPSGSAEAAQHLDRAVDFLRRAGTLHHLPLALLARGTPQDLDEVFRIASRSGMRLHLADYHLASARLALRHGDRARAREHLAQADALVRETGYHRRDPDLAQLRGEVA